MTALKADWIAPTRTALLLIDCQVDFGSSDGAMAKQGMDMRAAQAALGKIESLTAAARDTGVAVVFVRLLQTPGMESAVAREARARHGDAAPPLCVEGTSGADFCGSQPLPGEMVVTKQRFSVFAGTGLDQALHARRIDTLVLAGLTTDCCVQSSAWDGFDRDFHIVIASDACAAYAPDLHQGALKALEMSGAWLAMTDDIVTDWKKGN